MTQPTPSTADDVDELRTTLIVAELRIENIEYELGMHNPTDDKLSERVDMLETKLATLERDVEKDRSISPDITVWPDAAISLMRYLLIGFCIALAVGWKPWH